VDENDEDSSIASSVKFVVSCTPEKKMEIKLSNIFSPVLNVHNVSLSFIS